MNPRKKLATNLNAVVVQAEQMIAGSQFSKDDDDRFCESILLNLVYYNFLFSPFISEQNERNRQQQKMSAVMGSIIDTYSVPRIYAFCFRS